MVLKCEVFSETRGTNVLGLVGGYRQISFLDWHLLQHGCCLVHFRFASVHAVHASIAPGALPMASIENKSASHACARGLR